MLLVATEYTDGVCHWAITIRYGTIGTTIHLTL